MAYRVWAAAKAQRLGVLAGLAALAYNNWLLGPWLNPNLFKYNGSVSEYSVASQPYHWLFQALDISSGVLLIILAYRLRPKFKAGRSGRILTGGLAVLGVANIFDAVFMLPCSETLNPACYIPVSVSLSHFQLPAHAYSSTIIGICYLLLPLAALAYGLKHKITLVSALSLAVIANSLFSLASALAGYIRGGALTTKTSGGGQEIQMVLLGIWLVALVAIIENFKKPPVSETG